MYSVVVKTNLFKRAIKACILGLDLKDRELQCSSMFRLTVSEGGIAIQAGRLATSIIRVFVPNLDPLVKNQPFDIGVSASKLDGISNVPDLSESVVFHYAEGTGIVSVKLGAHMINLPVTPSDVFPSIDIEDSTIFPSKEIVNLLPIVSRFCGEDDTMPHLKRLLINFERGEVVGTDGFRMAVAKLRDEFTAPVGSLLIENDCVKVAVRALSYNEDINTFSTMSISPNGSLVVVSVGNTMIAMRASEKAYPAYKAVLNSVTKSPRTYYSFDKEAFEESVKIAKRLYGNGKVSTLFKTDGLPKGLAQLKTKDLVSGEEMLSLVDYEILFDEDHPSAMSGCMDIKLNTANLSVITSCVKAGRIVLEVVNSLSGVVIREDDIIYVTMPYNI